MNMQPKTKLLVVDDKAAMRGLLNDYFTEQGYQVSTAQDGELALGEARSQDPVDIILLDLMMPRVDGFDFLRRFRISHDTPVIVITAKESEIDAVVALELGADDYVMKPVRLKELEARIQAVLRRRAPRKSPNRLVFGEVELNAETHDIFVAQQLVKLTPTEFQLLKLLMEKQPNALSKEQLIKTLSEIGIDGLDTTLKVHIRNLRHKLNLSGADIIQTVFGVGYKLG